MKYKVLPPTAYTLPYIGVDLSQEPWDKVIDILRQQAESYKIFLENANSGFEWANECNKFMIEEFNRKTLNSIKIYEAEMQRKLYNTTSIFKLKRPEVPVLRRGNNPQKRRKIECNDEFHCDCKYC